MKKKLLVVVGILAAVLVGGGVWLSASTNVAGQFGPVEANPAYIAGDTATPVTFTAQIGDSGLQRHDPQNVLLLRTDLSGKPVDILGRMQDNGKRADTKRNDSTYTIRVTLTEPTVGPLRFRIAARFRHPLSRQSGQIDWHDEVATQDELKDKNANRDRQARLLRKLDQYTLSETITVTSWDRVSVGGVSLLLPEAIAAHQPFLRIVHSGDIRTVELLTISSITQRPVSQAAIVVYPKLVSLSPQDWFRMTIDQDNVLMSSGSYAVQTLADGRPSIERADSPPESFINEHGPIASIYAPSLDQRYMLAIVESQANELDVIGIPFANQPSLLSRLLQTTIVE